MITDRTRAELLYLYVKNHYIGLLPYIGLATVFVFLRVYLYGVPSFETFWMMVSCLVVIALVISRQMHLYRKIMAYPPESRSKDVRKDLLSVMALKFCYVVPWLIFIFWPLQSDFLYYHLLGYAYVFCILAVYISLSAACFSLFLFDVLLHLAAATLVTLINYQVQETLFVGAFIGIFGIFTLTAGRKIYQSTMSIMDSRQKLEKAMIEARQANQAKSDFLGIISHEIRTPMVGIIGMVNMLEETEINPMQREYVHVVQQCSKSLLNTLNDLLDTARMEAGTFVLNQENFDFHALITNTAKIILPIAHDKNISFTTDIDANVPVQMHGDPNRLQQILVNLLNNAVKFTEQGEVNLQVGYSETEGNRTLRISVNDTGIGITTKDQKKLFHRFSQADSSISRKYGGTGLGLSITKTLVEMMHGNLGVISHKGKGSTFWVEIPYAAPLQETLLPEIIPENSMGRNYKVLLVEDNAINRIVTIKLLESRGHLVTVVQEAASAINEVQKQFFDVVLMDINLPGMDGIQATREIRNLGKQFGSLPIIALSATGMQTQLDACREAGMVDWIIKPYAPAELFDKLDKHILKNDQAAVRAEQTLTMNHKLQAIREEFGDEYMAYLFKSSLQEIDRLLPQLRDQVKRGRFDLVRKTAHELKGVSGSVGLDAVYLLSERLEKIHDHGSAGMAGSLLRTIELRLAEVQEAT